MQDAPTHGAGAAPQYRPRLGTVLAFALLTMLLGIVLRFALAGWVAWPTWTGLQFAHLRHAHSHLGYYGVLFPLLWWAWHALGPSLSRWETWSYSAACWVSLVSFAWAGYWWLSIAASTAIGVVWLRHAYVHRVLSRRSDGFAPGPVAVVVACCFVPPIAVFTRRDPALAQALVHTFLGVLLLGLMAPAALATLRLRALPWGLSSWTYLTLSLISAMHLGGMDRAPLPLATVGLGVVLAVQAQQPDHTGNRLPWTLRLGWWALAAGFITYGLGVLPRGAQVSVAGVHFAILGPLLVTFARAHAGLDQRWLEAAWLSLAGFLCGTLVLQDLGLGLAVRWLNVASAGAGMALWLLLCMFAWQRRAASSRLERRNAGAPAFSETD